MNRYHFKAYAKINVGLEILHRRDDGYHAINSVFVPVSLYDDVVVEQSDEISLESTPAVTSNIADNLIYRAMAELCSLGCNPAKIWLRKNIPSGAGLGGGSSDAGTLLRELGVGIDPRSLQAAAEHLGSDVPFFLQRNIALVTGRGEHVIPVDIIFPWTIVLVTPNVHVSTASAFSTVLKNGEKQPTNLIEKIQQLIDNKEHSSHDLNVNITNDFEPLVFEQHSYLSTIKNDLYSLGAIYASMSGSGSSFYGLYTDVDKAHLAHRHMSAKHPTYICHSVAEQFAPTQHDKARSTP